MPTNPYHRDMLDEAIYTPRRLGALAGVSGQTIGQWARNDLIRPTVLKGRPSNLYSFFDAAEAVAVRSLMSEGFSYPEIHHAIEGAREQNRGNWPLSRSKVGIARESTKGDRGLIVLKDAAGYVDVTRGRGQATLKPRFWLAVRDILRSGGWLAKELNLTQLEVEPGCLGGRPTLAGTRWTVTHVAAIGSDAEGRDLLRREYGLARRGIDECLAWTEAAEALQHPRSRDRVAV